MDGRIIWYPTKKRTLPKEESCVCSTKGAGRRRRLSFCTSRNPKSSSFEYLTDDLVTEILLRVPVKALHRSMCVSKHWLSLISSPSFARSYILTDHDNNMLLLFQTMSSTCLFTQVYALPLLPGSYDRASSIPFTFDFVVPLFPYVYDIINYYEDNLWEVTSRGGAGGHILS
ncbi:hypothetical protein RND81_02G241700 [Saponaria officinalis]|uniref:F-box domain-containing protein n=1 Tax=Saponaria officinalis TaxID=3572 RepID=A0AAW1MWS7_SAPOF